MIADVVVFADLSTGALDEAGKGILAEGQRLASLLGTTWGAVAFAGAPESAYAEMRPYGVPAVLELRGPPELADQPIAQAGAVADAARAAGARVVLLAHTDLGATLAPAIAARLGGALFTEAVSYGLDWAGLTVRRKALGTQVMEARVWAGAARREGVAEPGAAAVAPLVLTLSPRVLSPVVLSTMKPGAATRTVRDVPATSSGAVRVVERIPPDPQTMDVAEAGIIFTSGKGCDKRSFDLVCELAKVVGASVGVTRPVFDLGWTGFNRMIGQTGRSVAPRLYFAVGISGSMHHLGGIVDSKRIVCLNVDPKAPIFPNADEGFVADASEVLPRLLERARAATAGAVEAA